MDIPANLLPTAWLWLAALLYAVLLVAALLTAPWQKLTDNEGSNVYFGAIACTALVWILRAGIEPGHNYHLLGMTALCLMFEWQFALVVMLVVGAWIASRLSGSRQTEFVPDVIDNAAMRADRAGDVELFHAFIVKVGGIVIEGPLHLLYQPLQSRLNHLKYSVLVNADLFPFGIHRR